MSNPIFQLHKQRDREEKERDRQTDGGRGERERESHPRARTVPDRASWSPAPSLEAGSGFGQKLLATTTTTTKGRVGQEGKNVISYKVHHHFSVKKSNFQGICLVSNNETQAFLPSACVSKHPTANLGTGVTWPISYSLLQCGPTLRANKIGFKGEFHLSVGFHIHDMKKKK